MHARHFARNHHDCSQRVHRPADQEEKKTVMYSLGMRVAYVRGRTFVLIGSGFQAIRKGRVVAASVGPASGIKGEMRRRRVNYCFASKTRSLRPQRSLESGTKEGLGGLGSLSLRVTRA